MEIEMLMKVKRQKVQFGYNKPERLIGFNGIIRNKVWVFRKWGSSITTPHCISNPPTYPFPSDTMVTHCQFSEMFSQFFN